MSDPTTTQVAPTPRPLPTGSKPVARPPTGGPKKPPTFKPVERRERLNILVYGQPGAGKTFLIGTAAYAPELFGRILLIAPDPGTLTLAFDAKMNEQIDVFEPKTTDAIDEMYEWLRLENPKLPPEEQYRTIGFDGLSDTGELAMLETLQESHVANPDRDPDLPGIDHHGKIKIITRRIIRQYRDLELNFFATALEKEETDKLGKKYILPAVGSGLSKEVAAFFDVTAYLYTQTDAQGNVDRYLRTHPDGTIQAKDRTRRLDKVLKNPTLPDVYRMISDRADKPAVTQQVMDPKIQKKPKN